MMKKLLFIFFIGLGLASCSTSADSVQLTAQSYYPLRVGNYQLYNVKYTTINSATNTNSTINYQLRVSVTDSIKNANGGYTYILHRDTLINPAHLWAPVRTWTARITNNHVIANENGTYYYKFSYPLQSNSTWNGNLYNDLGIQNYTVQNVGRPYTSIDGKNYANTFTVIVSNNKNLVYENVILEVYAPAIGLIYKESTLLNYCTDGSCFGKKTIQTGTIIVQSLVSYGHR